MRLAARDDRRRGHRAGRRRVVEAVADLDAEHVGVVVLGGRGAAGVARGGVASPGSEQAAAREQRGRRPAMVVTAIRREPEGLEVHGVDRHGAAALSVLGERPRAPDRAAGRC